MLQGILYLFFNFISPPKDHAKKNSIESLRNLTIYKLISFFAFIIIFFSKNKTKHETKKSSKVDVLEL